MKIIDSIYYALYIFSRKRGRTHMSAGIFACVFSALTIVITILYAFFIARLISDGRYITHKTIKPYFIVSLIVLMYVFYVLYDKKGRGERVVREYNKIKKDRLYFWLGVCYLIWPWLMSFSVCFIVFRYFK